MERGVGVAGRPDEELAVPAAGGAAQLEDVGPDDEIGVDPRLLEAVDQPAARGALAVRAGDGDPLEMLHQLAEELGVFVDSTTPLPGRLQLGVILPDRR